MPTYQPGTLGPLPRDPGQTFWDPDAQTMPREQLEDLQLSRLQELVDRVLKNPVPLFERKLRAAGIERAEDIATLVTASGLLPVPLPMLFGFFGLTFASAAIGVAIMGVGPAARQGPGATPATARPDPQSAPATTCARRPPI